MPRHFIDELDDTLLLDGQTSLTGGQVSNVRANLLTPNQGTLLQDVDAEVNGVTRTRRGFRCFGNLKALSGTDAAQALQWFDSVTGEYLIAVAGGKIYRGDAAGTWTLIESGAVNSSSLPADLAQVNDHLFASTRDSRPRYWTQANLAGTGTAQVETATAVGTITVGVQQVETAFVGGAATTANNVVVTVAGAGLGGPITRTIGVIVGDSAATVASKIQADLATVGAITALYTVTVSALTASVALTRITAAANDATLNLAIDGLTNATGVPNSPTSTHTTAGVAGGGGNMSVTVTGAAVGSSPFSFTVAGIVAGDSPATWAGKVRADMLTHPEITTNYTVGGSDAEITLTKLTPATHDATLNIALANGTCTGITAAPTSEHTVPGALYGVTITDGPAKLAFLTAQKFRLFGINPDAIDQLYTSEFLPDGLTPFTIGTPLYSVRIGEGEGDPITGLFAWKGFTMLVFKEGSIWSLDTTPGAVDSTAPDLATGFTIQRLSGRTGCLAHRSVAMCGNDVYFLARDGVRSLAKVVGDESGAVSDAVSFPIEDYIQRINWPYAANACACYWQGRYLLAVPLDTSTVNNAVLVYRPQTQAWTVWTGLNPVQFAVSRFNGQPQKLAVLNANGNVLVWRDFIPPDAVGTTDFRDELVSGTDARIAWKVRTKALTYDEPLNPKQPEFLELEFVRSTALVNVDVIADGNYAARLVDKLTTGTAGVTLPVTLPFTLGTLGVERRRKSMTHYAPAREVVVEIREPELSQMTPTEAANSGYLSLRSLQTGAFVETMGDDR